MVVLLDPFVLLKDVGVVLGVNDLLLVFVLSDLFSLRSCVVVTQLSPR